MPDDLPNLAAGCVDTPSLGRLRVPDPSTQQPGILLRYGSVRDRSSCRWEERGEGIEGWGPCRMRRSYELRMCDWSADVCSSDLDGPVMFSVVWIGTRSKGWYERGGKVAELAKEQR